MNEQAAKAIRSRIEFLKARGAEIPAHISVSYLVDGSDRTAGGDAYGWACSCGVGKDTPRPLIQADNEMRTHAANERKRAEANEAMAPLVAAIQSGTTDVKDVLALTEGDYDLAISGAIKAKNTKLYNALVKARATAHRNGK